MAFQMGGNILDFLVLAALRVEDSYGYILTQKAKDLMEVSDSTLYLVLRKLQKDGMLETHDQPFQGRNRRYYSITEPGKTLLDGYIDDWNRYKTQIELILAGGKQNEHHDERGLLECPSKGNSLPQ